MAISERDLEEGLSNARKLAREGVQARNVGQMETALRVTKDLRAIKSERRVTGEVGKHNEGTARSALRAVQSDT